MIYLGGFQLSSCLNRHEMPPTAENSSGFFQQLDAAPGRTSPRLLLAAAMPPVCVLNPVNRAALVAQGRWRMA